MEFGSNGIWVNWWSTTQCVDGSIYMDQRECRSINGRYINRRLTLINRPTRRDQLENYAYGRMDRLSITKRQGFKLQKNKS